MLDLRKDLHTVHELPSQPAHAAFVEKKSEFISDICHTTSLGEVASFMQSMRIQHPKARHIAYAAVCGASDSQFCERMSDDGEPSGTAGKPILDVLRASNLTDCVITVTRYFGGILLGSGGLTRAYARAASMAVSSARIVDIISCTSFICSVQYTQLRMLEQIIRQVRGIIDEETFGAEISIRIAIPTLRSEEFLRMVQNAFSGALKPKADGEIRRIRA